MNQQKCYVKNIYKYVCCNKCMFDNRRKRILFEDEDLDIQIPDEPDLDIPDV